jgi:hypothetical protein
LAFAGVVTESEVPLAANFRMLMRWFMLKEWVTDDKRTQFTAPTWLGSDVPTVKVCPYVTSCGALVISGRSARLPSERKR